ncbi:MAG: pilin [Patescibacteria group bacterium]|nr:pilin [Patescibacteria group bacterium]
MRKIVTGMATAAGLLVALPAFAQLSRTVNQGLGYATIVGWGTQDLRTTIMLVINILMGFLGIIAVLIVLYGGFKWMTAGGNEEQVGEAKKMIIAGVVGLAVIFMAYAIASFVVQQLSSATGG